MEVSRANATQTTNDHLQNQTTNERARPDVAEGVHGSVMPEARRPGAPPSDHLPMLIDENRHMASPLIVG